MHENISMMKKFLILAVSVLLMLSACEDYEKTEEKSLSERTVLVYMSGENNLSDGVQDDISEMLMAKTDTRKHVLLVYVDEANSKRMPYLARIRNGQVTDSVSIKDMGISESDICSVEPSIMKDIINYAFKKYPSHNNDYGLVLWGHASGWAIEDSIPTATRHAGQRKAYGLDTGQDSNGQESWINIHSLAELLSQCPHLTYIFADCCNFQCLESLYELRNVADYIIGSPAEIPGVGAPYTTLTPALFEPDSFYTAIIDRYYEQTFSYDRRVPLSAVKTSAMVDLADATRKVLLSIKDTLSQTSYPNIDSLIHYYRYNGPLFNDANDFILRYAKPESYATWKKVLDEAVVYKKMAKKWITNIYWETAYTDFEMTEERYGGVSMFVPQNPLWVNNYRKYNEDIKKTAWYYAAGLSNLGW